MATKKIKDAAPAAIETIASTIATLEKELYLLTMQKNFGELKETHKLKQIRKEIARNKTAMRAHTI